MGVGLDVRFNGVAADAPDLQGAADPYGHRPNGF
jgi:hypothetical protein